MKKVTSEGFKSESLSSQAVLLIAGTAIGFSYALATILGFMGAQRIADPNLPIPEEIIRGLFIGTAIWAALSGLSIRANDEFRIASIRPRLALGWLLICFATCTAIPLLYAFQNNLEGITIQWKQILLTSLFSALSFGVGGVIIGLTAILLHLFFWRLLIGLKWGILLTCALGFLLGLCSGWAAYGWIIFSTQAFIRLNIIF